MTGGGDHPGYQLAKTREEARPEPDDPDREQETTIVNRKAVAVGSVAFAAVAGVYVAVGTSPLVVAAGALLAGVVVEFVEADTPGATAEAILAPFPGIALVLVAGGAATNAGATTPAMVDRLGMVFLFLFASPVFALLGALGNRTTVVLRTEW